MRYVVLNKEVGETPLMALRAWKETHPEYADTPLAYAGRLDPMAEGKLLILLGEECKHQDRYRGLDKEYEIEVLIDVGSDTGDALGIVTLSPEETQVEESMLRAALKKEEGVHMRAYPAYSSKTVNGKPLFLHALEGTLTHIEIPEHEEHIYSIAHLGTETLSASALHKRVVAFLQKVPKTDEESKVLGADFRIDAVRESWDALNTSSRTFSVLRLRIACGSGTYMRSLAGRIGESLGTKALALSIRRTKIGKRFLGLWTQLYS